MADYVVKAGSIPGPLQVELSYSDGTTPDLSPVGTTVLFRLQALYTGHALVTRAGRIVNATTVAYDWQAADLARAPGLYQAEFQVTWQDGRVEIFPADEAQPFLQIYIAPAISA